MPSPSPSAAVARCHQPQFAISTAPTVKLVQSSYIYGRIGGNHESVCAMYDAGWVFNLSAGTGKKSELRFWLGQADTLDKVLADILGWHSPRWRGQEICELVQITRPLRKALTAAGDLPGVLVGTTFYATTEALQAMLAKRLVK